MKNSVVMIGVGEMGGVFARGILRTGHPVVPVTRELDMEIVAERYPDPKLVLVSVAEKDLHPVLEKLPASWHGCLGLLQNELLPRDWNKYYYKNPTVISVWFEKKKGQDARVLIPSPTFGPQAELLVDALTSLDIPVRKLGSEDELLDELVIKNVYILTTNITGLITASNVNDMWSNHQNLAREIANEVIDIQEWLTERKFDREKLIQGMVEGINGELDHMCMGRSAPVRLERAIQQADEAGLSVPRMREIQSKQ